jgi:hypothetical protein
MKKLFMVLPLVFLLCFTFSCQQGEEVAEEVIAEQEERRFGEPLHRGCLANDPNG